MSVALAGGALTQTFLGAPASVIELGTLCAGLLLGPTLVKNCAWFGPVKKRFTTDTREVWLTIDDGPNPEQTPYVLDVLGRHQVKATFFVIGKHVQRHPELARRILAEGHALQNHTYQHLERSFWAAGPRVAHSEIELCSRAIADITGAVVTQFRAPVGFANSFVHAAAATNNLTMIGWSATGCDGITHRPIQVADRIETALHPGSIVLLHDSKLPKMRAADRASTLELVLARLAAAGYACALPQDTALG